MYLDFVRVWRNIHRVKNMHKKLIVFVIAVLLTTTVEAKDTHHFPEPTRQIGFGLGGVHYQIRDDILAPLRWEGAGVLLNVSYLFHSKIGYQEITMRIPVAIIANRYDHRGFCDELNIRYDLITKMTDDESPRQVHFGGMLEGSLNHQLYLSWDDSHIYWLTTYTAGPVVRWSRAISQGQNLAVRFSFPLLALVSRPPEHRYYDQGPMNKVGYWFSKPHEDMRLTSVHEYISLDLKCDYNRQLSQKTMLSISFHSSYETDSKPQRIRLFTNSLLIQLLFKLGSS